MGTDGRTAVPRGIGDGDVTGPVVYVNGASKDDLAEIDSEHVSLQGAVGHGAFGRAGGGIRSVNPSWIPTTSCASAASPRS